MARYQVDWKNDDGAIVRRFFTSANSSSKAIDNTRYRFRSLGYEPNNYRPFATLLPERKRNTGQVDWVDGRFVGDM